MGSQGSAGLARSGCSLCESASWEPGCLQRGRPTPAPPSLRSPRLSPKHRDDGRKTGSQRSSGSRSPSASGGSGWGSPQQNGGSRQRSGALGGRPGSAHSPPDVRTLGFAEGSPLRFRGLRRAGLGSDSRRGGAVGGSRVTDTLSVPSSPTCAPQGAPGAGSHLECSFGCRLDVVPTWAWWSGEGLGVGTCSPGPLWCLAKRSEKA